MALTVTQLDRGGANGVTSFSTASVAAASNRLLILDLYFQPASPPVTLSPSVSGYGATWVREDDPAFDQYETMQRWRCEISSGSTDTVDLSWTGTCDVLWSLFEVSGHVTGNNGADAFVQTVREANNDVTLAAFADASNECLASFAAGYFPDPDGTVDSTLVQVGTTAASNPGLFLELVSGLGPEEGDDNYSITWVGQFIQRAVASEIAVAAGATYAEIGGTAPGAATGTLGLTGNAALSGSATPGAAGTLGLSGNAALTGSASPAASASLGLSGSASVSGTSSPAASATLGLAGSAAVSGTVACSATGTVNIAVDDSIAGTASCSVAATLGLSGDASISGSASAIAAATLGLVGSAAVGGTANASASGTLGLTADDTLSGLAACSVVATLGLSGSASISGAANCSASAALVMTVNGAVAPASRTMTVTNPSRAMLAAIAMRAVASEARPRIDQIVIGSRAITRPAVARVAYASSS